MTTPDLYIIHIFQSRQYLSVSDAARLYNLSKSTICRWVAEIKTLKRYKGHPVTVNDDGTQLVNTLILEDYLINKAALHSGLEKHLDPYDPARIRRERGEYRERMEE